MYDFSSRLVRRAPRIQRESAAAFLGEHRLIASMSRRGRFRFLGRRNDPCDYVIAQQVPCRSISGFFFCSPRSRRFEYLPPVGKLIPAAFGQTSPCFRFVKCHCSSPVSSFVSPSCSRRSFTQTRWIKAHCVSKNT